MSALTIALDLVGNDLTGGAFGSLFGRLAMLSYMGHGLGRSMKGAAQDVQLLEGAAIGAAAATVAFLGPLKDAIDTAGNLEMAATMAGIAISDGAQHTQELQDAIVQLADTSLYSITDIDQAFRLLGERGFTTAQILTGQLGNASVRLAEAMGVGATDGADVLSQALRLFTRDSLDANHAADELTRAFYDGIPSASGLSEYLGMVGGTANALRIPLKDVLVLGDMLTPMMGSASSAGASLNYMLRNLTVPTEKAAGEIKHLGLQVYDAHGNFVGIKNVIDQLIAKLAKLPQKDQMEAIGALFNVRSGRGATDLLSMLGQFDVRYNQLAADISKEGTAQKDANAVRETAIGRWKQLTTTVQSFGGEVGLLINNQLKPLYTALNTLVSGVMHNDQVKTFFAAFLVGGVVLGTLVTVLSAVIFLFVAFGPVMAAATTAFAGVVATAALLAGFISMVTTKGEEFTGWLSFLNPMVQAVRDEFAAFGDYLQTDLYPTLQEYQPVWDALGQVLQFIGGILLAALYAGIVLVANAFMAIIVVIGDVLKWVRLLALTWNDFANTLGWVFAGLVDVVTGHWDRLRGDLFQIEQHIVKDAKDMAAQMAKDQDASAKQQHDNAVKAALLKEADTLKVMRDAALTQAQIDEKAAQDDINYANQQKDAKVKAAWLEAAQVLQAKAVEQRGLAAEYDKEYHDALNAANGVRDAATSAAVQTANNVVNHATLMHHQTVQQYHLMRGEAGADMIAMRDDGTEKTQQLTDAINQKLKAQANKSHQWGQDLANNLAQGLIDGIPYVGTAVQLIGMAISKGLKHSVPEEGPLSDDDQWGGHLVANLANGMLGALPTARQAALQVAGAIANPLSTPQLAATGAYSGVLPAGGVYGGGNVGNITIPIYLNDQLLGEIGLDLVRNQLTMSGMARTFR